MEKLKLYSPFQVGCAAFFGGPIAAIYTLKKNFEGLSQSKEAKAILIAGMIFVILLVGVLPFLPDKFLNAAVPAGYIVAAYTTAKKFQLPNREAFHVESESARGIVAICVLSMVSLFAMLFVWGVLLHLLGFIG